MAGFQPLRDHIKGAIPADIMAFVMEDLGLPQSGKASRVRLTGVSRKLTRCLPDISAK